MGRIRHSVHPGYLWLLAGILGLYGVVIGTGDTKTSAILRIGLLSLVVAASLRLRVLAWPATATIGGAAVLASALSLWLATAQLRTVVLGLSSAVIIGTTIVMIV